MAGHPATENSRATKLKRRRDRARKVAQMPNINKAAQWAAFLFGEGR